MKCNSAVRNNIRSHNIDAIYQSIQTGSKEGMITMDQSIMNLIESGKVSYEAAMPHVRDDMTHKRIQEITGSKPPSAPTAAPTSSEDAATPVPNERPTNGQGAQQRPAPRPRGMAIPPWEQQGR
jgi:hypothetical protein